MKSATVPSFWKAYKPLDKSIKRRVKRVYKLWSQNPFHPSLHFKCINREENVWSVRITLGYRAIGIMDDDMVTCFGLVATMIMSDFSYKKFDNTFDEIFKRLSNEVICKSVFLR